ncbi:hypothetical protein ACQV2X_06730 [Facklamia sp. P12945]|uniref:hypothetical protein n=1 Tax=unclassified Facklamia TaxID=2622293 RepID=UPI003D18088F
MQVKITRNAYFMGGLMPLTVYQDGKSIGKIHTNETITLEVVEGSTIVVKQLGMRSNPLEVKSGDYIEISGKPWLGLLQVVLLISFLFLSYISDNTFKIISYFILPILYFSSVFLIENFKLEKKK